MRMAIFGASGYQGRLVLAEAVRRGLEPVAIGRDQVRLRTAVATIGESTHEVRVATVDDHAALVTAFQDCAVVVNCAGPFTTLGLPVVQAAIDAGRHYVDTAGEQPYVASVFATHGAAAQRAGVSIVPAANDGCLPIDLLAHLVAAGDDVEQISTLHIIDGASAMSRGSLRSLLTLLGTSPDNGVSVPPDALPFPTCEVVTIPRHVAVRRIGGFVNASLARRLATPPAPELIDSLPDGPDQDTRRRQRFRYTIDAVLTDGAHRRAVIEGRDTYGTTAVIAVESARRLTEDTAPHGVLAPAEAFDATDLLAFLEQHAVTWRIGPAEA